VKPPRDEDSSRTSVRLLRFAAALRVTPRHAPAQVSYRPEGIFRPSLTTGNTNKADRHAPVLTSTPIGQLTCYKTRTS